MNTDVTRNCDSRLLRLSPCDNVLTAIAALEPGDRVNLNGQPATLAVRIPFGHKLAVRRILAGEKIIKYGVPIGSATQAIERGEHVHTHNLKSDYLPTWRREDQLKQTPKTIDSP